MATITIDRRFNGFPDIALGGYVGGVLARGRARAEVSLRRPVRIGKPYQTVAGSDGTEILQDGNDILAVIREAWIDLEVPPPVDLLASKLAAQQFPGLRKHPVPTCFTCGTLRPDGLKIFPGDVPGRDVAAAPWIPAASLADSNGVKLEFIWSALDCPTIWALVLRGNADSDERAVTARLAVEQVAPVLPGQPQVVMGWKVSESGRTRTAGGAIYSADGLLLAKAVHTLVTTDWGVPMGLNRL